MIEFLTVGLVVQQHSWTDAEIPSCDWRAQKHFMFHCFSLW